MKKFTFKNVLDGFRSSVQQPTSLARQPETVPIVETLRPDHFQVMKTVRHGFPYQPSALAWDPIQKVLAVGTKQGSLRILGRPGVDVHVRHEADAAVTQIQFLVNEGALIVATADDNIHLWNYRQKQPQIIHSLKFQRERITCMFLPFQCKWLYIGTERGNVHVVNVEVFQLSGYIINWNKAIDVSRKTHPGSVVHLSDCPIDPSKLLIGYETGQIVVWDLRNKTADVRYQSAEPLRSIAWHHEGKQLMASHTDGSLTTWAVKPVVPGKSVSTIFPHAKPNKEGKQEQCKIIQKVEWNCSRTGESFVIFSGGLTNDRAGRTPSITVIHGKTTTVLEMEHNVVDFITLCESPFPSDFGDPYALVVLLQNDLVVVDLMSAGYPCFENPYSMDLHESPVTCCHYIADCPSDLIPAFYSVGARGQKRTGFSENEWPLSGGQWGGSSCSYAEMIITGHADGTIKFWDSSSVSLQVLYKLKTAKIFEKPRTKSIDGDEDPFAIQHISLCPESRHLVIAGATAHVILFKYQKQESSSEVTCLEIPIVYEVYEPPADGSGSPEFEFPPRPTLQGSVDYFVPIHVRGGSQKKPAGYQAELVCLTPWVNGDPPGNISALTINSSYGLLSYGNENGLVIVDYIQKSCVLNMGTPELYGSADPYQRVPKSPKRTETSSKEEDRCLSPSSDQHQLTSRDESDSDALLSKEGSEDKKDVKSTSVSRNNSRGKGDIELRRQVIRKDSKMKVNESKEEGKIDLMKYLGRKDSKNKDIDDKVEYTKEGDTESSLDSPKNGLLEEDIEDLDEEELRLEIQRMAANLELESSKFEIVESQPNISSNDIENRRPSRFRLKDHWSKLDAKFRRTFSLDASQLEQNSEFYIEDDKIVVVDDDGEMKERTLQLVMEDTTDGGLEEGQEACEIADDSKEVTECVNNIPNVNANEDSLSVTLKPSPKPSPKVTPKVTPKATPLTSPLEETKSVEGITADQMERRSSLSLFDKEGNPIPPPRRKVKLGESKVQESKGSISGDSRSDLLVPESGSQSQISSKSVSPADFNIVNKVSKSSSSHSDVTPTRTPSLPTLTSSITSPNSKGAIRSFVSHLTKKSSSQALQDKLDGTFSQSRSSSISSLENISSEAIQCLVFADSYVRKNDALMSQTLWVGTSLGSIIQVIVLIPPLEVRNTNPVTVAPSGTIFRLKGSIMAMSFLDCNGDLIPYQFESWRDANKEKKLERTPTKSNVNNRMSPTNMTEQEYTDRQFVVFVSEKVTRVVALPSQNCVYKQIITEVSFVVKSEIIQIKDAVCLVCYIATGHISVFSLPSLRQLIYTDFVPLVDLSFQTRKAGIVDPMLSIWGQQMFVNEDTNQIARTFCFTNYGHGMFLCSPTEIQKFSIASDFCTDLKDMLGELFQACNMPEPPKQSFFKGLFGGGVSLLDREELFGDASGKGNRAVAKHMPGPSANINALNARTSSAASEISRAHQLMVERGEKLGQVEERTEKMMNEAETFSGTAHSLMLRYKDKKWYQI